MRKKKVLAEIDWESGWEGENLETPFSITKCEQATLALLLKRTDAEK